MNNWKTIQSHPNYEASIDGKIRNKRNLAIIEGGYNRRYLRAFKKDIHRIIAETWMPNPYNYPQVNHINGNKHDNRVSNLEWCTAAHNVKHSFITGLNKGPKAGEDSNLSKLSDNQLKYIKSIHKPYTKDYSTRALALQYGVNESWLSNILNGNRRTI
jgi:hypothetical protein